MASERAQKTARNILSARDIPNIDDSDFLPVHAVNVGYLVKALSGEYKFGENPGCLYDNAENIEKAVLKDFDFTLEEAKQLREIYITKFNRWTL